VSLLVLDSLKKGFKKHEMEDALGSILNELRSRLENFARAVNPAESQVSACLAAIGWAPDATLSSLGPSAIPANGVEDFVQETALAGVVKDSRWFPLVSEATLHALTQSGEIAEDSFEYVVSFHYVSSLMDRVEALRAREDEANAFWKGVGMISASLSLSALLTPASAPAAAPLRGVALIADLAMTANAVHSVVTEVAELDRALSDTLIRPEAFGVAALGRIGQLVAMRAELVENLALHVALEAVLGLTPARFAALRRNLLARGYYQDIQTLLGDG
jgi:hypothetical protein